ncbi:CAP domain-containing protein [Kovacikia minuta CCNUW1]|uniref:CAP domain-containing protein n=1 Tax=Kovacikia minuta TaxID=2931930 RepID=UPI001CCC61C9|nr:CAP domain-containing protein [Kovacikia minuta]UBF24763.1 CAP domain-containing protein [Kovacikia minuta CCNUW1]
MTGENIAAGYSTPEQVVQGWINSPGHRANLLNPSYTELGIGYYYLANDTGSVNYKSYWTQDFGSGDRNPSSNLPA